MGLSATKRWLIPARQMAEKFPVGTDGHQAMWQKADIMKNKILIVYCIVLVGLIGFTLPLTHAQTESISSRIDMLDLKNTDVNDVLKLVSQKSGINIVATSAVKGRVTVYLKDVDVLEALRIIVSANEWAFVKEGEIIKVMTAQDFEAQYGYKFSLPFETRIIQLIYVSPNDVLPILNQMKTSTGKVLTDDKSRTIILMDISGKLDEMEKIVKKIDVMVEIKVFNLSYAKAEEISGKVTEILTPSLGQMRFDERSNNLIVSDTAAKLEKISRIIEAFDEKDREVLIKAKIVQVSLSNDRKLGIDWEAIVKNYHNLTLKNDFDILGVTDKKGTVGIGTLSKDDYTTTIEALETVGVTDILSSPSITAINNKEAKILIGSTEPYVTTTTTTPSSGPTTTAESVNFIEVGVKLYVTPTIHEDGFITMKIKPEVSSVVNSITTGNNNRIPVVETSEAETTVMVKDGITIVIGGLIKESKLKTTKKIPLFGDIPFFGVAFRNESDTVSKTEIVIFLTPRIISGDIPAEEGNRKYEKAEAK